MVFFRSSLQTVVPCAPKNTAQLSGIFESSAFYITAGVGGSAVKYEGRLISNAHSEIFCRRSKVAMRAQCALVATTLLHSGAKFDSFLYTGSKTVRVNMESC